MEFFSIGEQPGRIKSERLFLLKGVCALGEAAAAAEGWRAGSHLTRPPLQPGLFASQSRVKRLAAWGGRGHLFEMSEHNRETPK